MIHKRPFIDNDSYEVACKHPRHMEHIDHLASLVPVDAAHQNPMISKGDFSLGKFQDVGRSVDDPQVSNAINSFESGPSGSFPHFLWIGNGILEVENVSFFPEYFDHRRQLRTVLQLDEVFSSIDYPLRKPVSIGPEHQAFVREWEGPNAPSNQLDKSNSQVALGQSSGPDFIVDDDYEERLMGTCIVPMPELEVSATHCTERTKTDCICHDQGSIGCVRRHVMEARQKLRENLGEEIFEGLGFNDMGEDVARKWTQEEEQVFYDVALSNPVSLGKNFWEHLSVAFPSRKRRELVSYYFNVFMLRNRSEQNRFDPLNIDSDNDEWQRSESGMADGDEDSAVESFNEQDDPACYQEELVEDCNEQIEDEDEIGTFKESTDDDVRRVATDEEYEGDIDDISVVHGGISSVDSAGDAGFKLFKGIPSNSGNDVDIEDDSCTSYEYQQDNADCCGPHDMASGGRHTSQE